MSRRLKVSTISLLARDTIYCSSSIFKFITSIYWFCMFVGMQISKQYFVKYKNLAHAHNRWVPEGDLHVTPGGPDLLSLYNNRYHTEKMIAFVVEFVLLFMRYDLGFAKELC